MKQCKGELEDMALCMVKSRRSNLTDEAIALAWPHLCHLHNHRHRLRHTRCGRNNRRRAIHPWGQTRYINNDRNDNGFLGSDATTARYYRQPGWRRHCNRPQQYSTATIRYTDGLRWGVISSRCRECQSVCAQCQLRWCTCDGFDNDRNVCRVGW